MSVGLVQVDARRRKDQNQQGGNSGGSGGEIEGIGPHNRRIGRRRAQIEA